MDTLPRAPGSGRAGPRSASRLVGLDLARLVALASMVTAHLLASTRDGEVTVVHQVVAGRSSGLFAVLAGVGLVLLARTRTPLRGTVLRAELAAAWARAAGLGVLGLLLGGLVDTNLSVILTYYAVLFALAAPFLALSTRWIATAGVGLLVLGPPLSLLLRTVVPADAPGDPSPASLLAPLDLLGELLLTGAFPVLTWLPFVLAGVVVGRLDLRSSRVGQRLVAVGAGLALAAWAAVDVLLSLPGVRARLEASVALPGPPADLELALSRGLKNGVPTDTWAWLLVRAPHSGTWFDQVNVIGSSCLVIGACLLVGQRLPGRLVLLTGAGTVSLTLYTLHVVSLHRGLVRVPGHEQLLWQLLVLLALGALAVHLGRRGPLEALLARLSGAARARVLDRAAVQAIERAEPDQGADQGADQGPDPSLR